MLGYMHVDHFNQAAAEESLMTYVARRREAWYREIGHLDIYARHANKMDAKYKQA